MKRLISTSIIALAVSACSSYSDAPVASADAVIEAPAAAEVASLEDVLAQVSFAQLCGY